ncbi:lipocalin-like domain-containing protein [Herpetosiphon sp. NSE202]|uniref:lipocalin-like domain-containing protein n=1 Tax=Herpetosiphon sp. NSE202 TaxID=3351349 RepID=UPI00362C6B62
MRIRLIIGSLLIVALLAGGAWWLLQPSQTEIQTSISAVGMLSQANQGDYVRATEPRPFQFPADHGLHAGYRTEWWYYTGNLVSADGQRFGFQLTFFRSAATDQVISRTASLATSDIYMAHLGLTDVANQRFYAFERFMRGNPQLANATGDPFKVFVEDWQAVGSGPEGMTMQLTAQQAPIALNLKLESSKTPTLQGDRGLSQKGAELGNASYYYSLTNMTTSGTLMIDGREIAVTGKAWMDHEWGSGALEGQAVGWDWFAIQLDDQRELTYFNIRNQDGSINHLSGGMLTLADGSTRKIAQSELTLEVTKQWQSPQGIQYPGQWRLSLPSEQLELSITPQVANQEMPLTIRYWEGSVAISGNATGFGYVELTGYGDTGRGRAE